MRLLDHGVCWWLRRCNVKAFALVSLSGLNWTRCTSEGKNDPTMDSAIHLKYKCMSSLNSKRISKQMNYAVS